MQKWTPTCLRLIHGPGNELCMLCRGLDPVSLIFACASLVERPRLSLKLDIQVTVEVQCAFCTDLQLDACLRFDHAHPG